jgi:segregation and condensation protein A
MPSVGVAGAPYRLAAPHGLLAAGRSSVGCVMSFRVDLETYRGPLDLLLYLVRKHEVDITEIPLASVADQFLDYLAILNELDYTGVGEFLEMASILIEIKSRMVLPRAEQDEEPLEDVRQQLVEKLLEYKKYKDVSSMLEERGRRQQQFYARLANDLPGPHVDPAEQPIREVQLWDLVGAMGRMLRQNGVLAESTIVYDDTPIQVYMQEIHCRLLANGRMSLSETFQPGMHKSMLIGIFLAVLELVRHHIVNAEQEEGDGEIWVSTGSQFTPQLDLTNVETYAHRQTAGAPVSSC